MTVPVFLNPRAGRAGEVRKALASQSDLLVIETEPEDLSRRVADALDRGARRIAVAGGDGSISDAAGVLAGTETSLGIIPAGTLNHLARDLRIPLDLAEAAQVVRTGKVMTIDVGRAGGRAFLNTSSVGAYVLFVTTRERLEPRVGYWLASAVAAVRLLLRLRVFGVELEIEGKRSAYLTPLVFVGIGERELRLPTLGRRVDGGRRGLHVLVVRGRTRARLFAIALAAAARGVRHITRGPGVDAFLVEHCVIQLPFTAGRIAVDGEITEATGSIEYSLHRDALRVIVPWDG